MNMVRKALLISMLVLVVALLSAAVFVYATGPELPENTDALIDDVLQAPLPEVVRGEQGYAESSGWTIWYEHLEPAGESKGVVMLIMGIATDSLSWRQGFIDTFVDAGYEVIRFDNRGTGMSDWEADLDHAAPDQASAEEGYDLADMANDALAVLDALDIDQAHLVGMSMGGMIGQEFALNYPERTASLTSIMSSGFVDDPELVAISHNTLLDLLRVGLRYGLNASERDMIKLNIATFGILRGEAVYELDTEPIAASVLYNLRERRGFNPLALYQHLEAIRRSGSRYERLTRMEPPTLVIHGALDPIVPIQHGEASAAVMANASVLWIENMGHDIAEPHFAGVSEAILAHMRGQEGG
ncbi:alpha/beta hydrolase [Lujinxingia vulgaris]|uniref:Alpha/beta hydrolase n=1 Tax=Lujinxingia vulgaris TaxID=2600176 RepID=A0A5C6X986_9DELT|nr:alpha/beta hydrolase [Lujinxingia vulgaris]TXD38381.1 alpha/beta hydrolase [Lujinxingia vulgaris]